MALAMLLKLVEALAPAVGDSPLPKVVRSAMFKNGQDVTAIADRRPKPPPEPTGRHQVLCDSSAINHETSNATALYSGGSSMVQLRPLTRFAGTAVAALFAFWSSTPAQSEDEVMTVEQLLKSGWQVAGYAAAGGNRTAMVLFRHPSETYLVQCLTGYDVTRTPREFVNCYKLR